MANVIRGYTVVAYPESIGTDWEMQLDALPFGYCRALHDKDLKHNDDGSTKLKKSHIHFFFQGSPTKKQKEYIHDCLNVSYGEPVRSLKGFYNYLTHENNPDKYHYSKDIIQYSQKWCQELFDCNVMPTNNELTIEITDIILDNDITEYCDLMLYLIKNDYMHLISVSQQAWVRQLITSLRNKEFLRRNDARSQQ